MCVVVMPDNYNWIKNGNVFIPIWVYDKLGNIKCYVISVL